MIETGPKPCHIVSKAWGRKVDPGRARPPPKTGEAVAAVGGNDGVGCADNDETGFAGNDGAAFGGNDEAGCADNVDAATPQMTEEKQRKSER